MALSLLVPAGLFSAALAAGLGFHRARRLMGREPFVMVLGLVVATLAALDISGATASVNGAQLPLSTTAALPAWLGLSLVSWLGRSRDDVASSVLPQMVGLLLFSLVLLLLQPRRTQQGRCRQLALLPWQRVAQVWAGLLLLLV